MKQTRKIILSSIVVLLPMLVGLCLWSRLPDSVPTSFSGGEITGYSSKLFAVVGLPLILFAAHLVCLLVTLADPKRANIGNSLFSVVVCIVPAVSVLGSALMYGTALGCGIHTERITPVAIGILFVILGSLLPGCKQNYTVGIKLPWTIHDEQNWEKTHKMAGPLWVAGGLIMVVAGFLQWIAVFVAVIFVLAALPAVYSYVLYKRGVHNAKEHR